jgi:hypothetical protein
VLFISTEGKQSCFTLVPLLFIHIPVMFDQDQLTRALFLRVSSWVCYKFATTDVLSASFTPYNRWSYNTFFAVSTSVGVLCWWRLWFSSSDLVLFNGNGVFWSSGRCWMQGRRRVETSSLIVWLVADGWCWFILIEQHCWWLLVTGLFWEKSTVGWWLISQTNRALVAYFNVIFTLCYISILKSVRYILIKFDSLFIKIREN